MDFNLSQTQGQVLSPQMIQSMEMLQMDSQELLAYIQKAAQENPVLELHEQYDGQEENLDLMRRLEWLESNDPQNRDYYRQDSESRPDPVLNCGTIDGQEEELLRHLLIQLQGLGLEPEVEGCARFLAGCLDQNGWLREDLSELAREQGQPEEVLERALAVLQGLEPAGIAARNLSECLCLQLLRRQPVDELALRISAEYLDALSKCRYGLIARSLRANQDAVIQACETIRSLDPRPGSRFAAYEAPAYITPDLIVVSAFDHFELLPNDRFLPALGISPYYVRLRRESNDAQVTDYLANKIRQAKWLIRAVEQRKSTLMACAKCILELQEDFFRHGPGYLKPLSLADVAQRVGVHGSTVSRAVSGKYLQCAMGSYPLSYFFSRRLASAPDGSAASADTAKALLSALVAQEDKQKPLSDEKLRQRMAGQGCVLSRRTVAKYRDELGIPGTTGRRQHNGKQR